VGLFRRRRTDADRITSAKLQALLGVGKVALNDLAKRGIVKRGERKGTYALLGPQYGCRMTIVKHVLDEKGHDVHFIHPDSSVFDALKMMAENNIGSLVVLEDGKLVGIITERHYAREIVLKGRTSLGTLVRDIMSTKVIYARPDQSVQECMAVMTARAVRHLPVLERGRLVGIVSIGDMVKSVIDDQKFIIEQLEHFIHGDR
jgi:CBS domain-containing protein